MKKILIIVCFLLPIISFGQINGRVNGRVKDKNTQQLLIGSRIILMGKDTLYTQSDIDGSFMMEASVGNYILKVEMLGYESVSLYNISVNSGNAQVVDIEMNPQIQELEGVVVSLTKSVRATDMVTPLSSQKLTFEEIRVNPGGNFDVSKVIQVLPGVAGGTTPNRNDIIVRGGGSSENVYYLDGIEIPVLNHFQTQGASGGATGILNVSFINDVQLTASAFDSKYDNALASTFVIKQRNGNPDRLSGNLRLSGSEFATTLEGPLSKKITFMASARRSYLQFLFQLLDVPIRTNYWDFQYKIHHRINKKTELVFIGLGAIDNFRIEATKATSAENEYILRANPLIDQWNYTIGASLKRLLDNGYYTLSISRNMLDNSANRYENNALKSGDKLFSLNSQEIENKLRIDVDKYLNDWKLSYGIGGHYVKYNAALFNAIRVASFDDRGVVIVPAVTYSGSTAIDFFKMGAYIHSSRYFINQKILVSGGLRSDMNTFTTEGMNPLKTISPRLSLSYALNARWNVAGSVGSYYKLPVYTALGYQDTNSFLPNKDLDYINALHYTFGTQFVPKNDFRFTIEAFYKDYTNYPVSVVDGISIANIGTDFSAIGNEEFVSSGKGRVYGIEGYVQKKLVRNIFYLFSATIYKSEFSGVDGRFRPSTWDYGYVLATTLGYKFRRNWDVGIKYRISGGQPYTPFDIERSKAAYLTYGQGVYDYNQLNTKRLSVFQQLDLRVDKKINFKKSSLILYVDCQNVFYNTTPFLPKYTFKRNDDNTGFATIDGNAIASDGSNAIPVILEDKTSIVVPAIGFIFEF